MGRPGPQRTPTIKNPRFLEGFWTYGDKPGTRIGAPGGIRTPDQWLRKPLLYPAELRAPGRALCQNRRHARDPQGLARFPACISRSHQPKAPPHLSVRSHRWAIPPALQRFAPENSTSKARATAANSDVRTAKRMTAARRRCYPLQHEQARFRERAHGPCADVARAPGTVLEVGSW